MDIHELKTLREQKFSALFSTCGMFFAFSDKQFEENKTALKEGEKYIKCGMGAYMPEGNMDKWKKGCDEVNQWFNETIKQNDLRRSYIAYELANHEAFYTGDIQSTLDALGEGYTEEEVYKIYTEEIVDYNI